MRAADFDNRLASQGRELANGLHGQMSAADAELCMTYATEGFHEGLEPAMFHIGPGRWLDVNPFVITVENAGKQTATRISEFLPGDSVFLPVQFTELAGAAVRPRYFLELFAWQLQTKPGVAAGR